MSEVNPPTSPPAKPHNQTGGNPKAVVINPPDAFTKKIALGARIEASLFPASQKGRHDIQTTLGRITLQSTIPLPNDGILQLQLISKGNQLQFLITTINGLAPLTALRALNLLPNEPKNLTGKTNATNKASEQPKKLQSILDHRVPQETNQKALKNNIPTGENRLGSKNSILGAKLTATILIDPLNPAEGRGLSKIPSINYTSLAPKSAGALSGQQTTLGLTVSALKGSLKESVNLSHQVHQSNTLKISESGKKAPRHTQTELSSGAKLTVQVTAFQATPETNFKGSTQASRHLIIPGSTLIGTVTNIAMPSGHPIIITNAGFLKISTSISLPIGSQLTVKVVSLNKSFSTKIDSIKTTETPQSLPLRRQWPALQDAVRILNETNPAAFQQLIKAVIPQPGPMLGGNIIFFIMALSGGNLSNWFGDLPTRALRLTNPELLARLKKDFGEIDRTAKSPNSREWRSTLIPFHDGIEVTSLRLSVNSKNDSPQEKGQGDKCGTNFIIDLDLNIIGRFQLDGLVYRERKRMDIIVRTENHLSIKVQNGIRSIYQNATDEIGLMGGVVFQASPANFIETSDSELNDKKVGLLV